MTRMKSIRRLRNLLSLSIDIMNNNKKFMLPTMIGLVIALTVVSQSFLLIESSRGVLFEELVAKDQSMAGNEHYSDISIQLSACNPGVLGADRYTDFEHYNTLLNSALTNYEDIIAEYSWYSEPIINIGYPSYEYLIPISTSSSSTFFENLQPLIDGSLPKNSSEVVLIRPNSTLSRELYSSFIHGLKINSSILLEIPNYLYQDSVLFSSDIKNKSVTISGIITVPPPTNKYSSVDPITQLLTKYLNHTYTQTRILTSPEHLNHILNDVYPDKVFLYLEAMSKRYGFTHLNGKLFLKTDKLNIYNPAEEKRCIQRMVTSIENDFIDRGYIPRMHFDILTNFDIFIASTNSLFIMLLLVGSPVIIVSFYLMTYSFDLIKRQKNKQLGIIKTRGTSWKQIIIALYSEIFFTTIISSILAFVLSIFFASIFLRSSDYILFTGNNVNVKFSPQIFIQVLFIGLLASVFINVLRIFKTSREDIEQTNVLMETKEPIWKRYYLDLIIFIIGIILWNVLISFINNKSDSNLSNEQSLQIFFIITPFLIFLGSLGLIGRLFYAFIRVIKIFTYLLDLGLFTFGLQNLVRHKHAASRTALLLTITIAISTISSFLIFSLDETEQLRIYTKDGADISFSYTDYIPVPPPSYYGSQVKWTECIDLTKRNQIKQIPHVVEISTIFKAEAKAIPGEGVTEYHYYHFLFINTSNYADTVEIHPEFQLNGDLKDLKGSSVLLLRKNFDALEISMNEQIELNLFSYLFGWGVDRLFRIKGTFDYWPNLIFDPSDDFTKEFWIIGDFNLLERLYLNQYLTNVEARGIINVDSTENAQNVSESIFEITGYKSTVSYLENERYLDSFTRNFNLAVLNTNVIITMVISLVVCLMFSFHIILERGKEIGIERAIGISRLGIAKLCFIESVIILFFGTFMGFLAGSFFTQIFFQIIQIGEANTPFVIIVPFEFVISDLSIKVNEIVYIVGPIFIGLFVLTAIIMVLPAYLASRTDITRVLKVE